MGVCSTNSAEKIKDDEAEMAEPVFDVITEYPQIKHVTSKMEQSAMHEHGRKDCQGRMDRLLRFECKEVVWYCPVRIRYCIHPSPGRNLQKKHGDIEDNDPDCEKWEQTGGIIVFIGYHAVSPSS